jgi:aspartate/methionine/tyrosine aminotransferase
MRDILARRVAGFGTTIFTEMSALAVQHGAVNLGQGFPDFPGPEFIKQAAVAAINADLNQYPPMPGVPRLRRAIAAQWEHEHSRVVDWQSEVTITSGATEALCDLALALLDPGDAAIVIEPAYDAYIPDITMAGGVPLVVRMHPPAAGAGSEGDTWRLDEAKLRAAFARRPRFILVNTPHNPTGKVFGRAELELIAGLCQEYDVLAICDEVYDRLVFDDNIHLPLATLPGMWERTITLGSTGKTFGVTGWKVGWAIGAAQLNHALRQAHQWVTFTTPTPLQEATAAALEAAPGNGYFAQLRAEYDERRRFLHHALEAAGLPVLPVQGAYFISADIGALGIDDRAFCRWLTTEVGVAAIPTSVFYSDQAGLPALARFCFAKKRDTLEAAAERLKNIHRVEYNVQDKKIGDR